MASSRKSQMLVQFRFFLQRVMIYIKKKNEKEQRKYKKKNIAIYPQQV